MNFKKLISIWALLALILGQVALAEHSASHIEHDFPQEISAFHEAHDNHDAHHHHEHDENHKKRDCPECSMAHSLQVAFYNAPAALAFKILEHSIVFSKESVTIIIHRYSSYSPRAPPTFLI